MSDALIRLLGDMATPAVVDLLKANESLDWSLPIQRRIVKKKNRLIQPGLQPVKIMHVGGVVGEQKKKWKQKYVKPRLYVQSPTFYTIGQLAIPWDAAQLGETVIIGGEIFEVWITKEGRRILIGAGIFRNANVANVGKVPALFNDPVIKNFESKIPAIAKNYEGVEISGTEHAAGVWEQNREPSFVISGTAHDSYAAEALAAKLAQSAPEQQMAAALWSENPQGEGAMYEMAGVKDHERAVQVLMRHGFTGQSVLFEKGRILLLDKDGAMRDNISKAANELGHRFTTNRGDVDFIGEEEYGDREKAYKQAHGPQAVGEASQVQDFPVSGSQAEELVEFIRKVGSRYVIFSQEGKRLGSFTSKAAAAKRLGEIEWFKKNKDEQRKRRRPRGGGHYCTPPPYPNSVGTRYWMGVGQGIRQQYGDYQQARPKLAVVLEQKKLEKWAVGFEHPAQGPHNCFECEHRDAPLECKLVAGVVEGGDWCKEWDLNTIIEGTSEHWVTIDGKHIPISTPSGQGSFPFRREMQAQAYARKVKAEEEKKAREGTPEAREEHLKSPVAATNQDPESAHSSQVIPVDLADGTHAIFKPESGAGGERMNIDGGFQTEREVGAWEVAKLVGMDDLVAPAVASELNGERGVMMEFQPGVTADFVENSYDGARDTARAAMFDYIIGNEDRHPGNWLVDENEKIHLIDHGLAFPDLGPLYHWHQEILDHASFHQNELLQYPVKEMVKPYVEGQSKIVAAMQKVGLPAGSIRGVKERIQKASQFKDWEDIGQHGFTTTPGRTWSGASKGTSVKSSSAEKESELGSSTVRNRWVSAAAALDKAAQGGTSPVRLSVGRTRPTSQKEYRLSTGGHNVVSTNVAKRITPSDKSDANRDLDRDVV